MMLRSQQWSIALAVGVALAISVVGGLKLTDPPAVAAAAVPTATAMPRVTKGPPPPPPTEMPTATPRPTRTPAPAPTPSQFFAPVADAFVRGGVDATTAFGTQGTLEIKDGSANYDRRAFLRFDLRSIAASSVRRAALTIVVKDLPNGVPASFRVAAVADDSWNETTLTWNSQPALGSSGMQYIVAEPGVLTLDMTGYVNTQLGGDKQVSLALFDDSTAGRMVRCFSHETGQPPLLAITP
jgi:hypothetical protein